MLSVFLVGLGKKVHLIELTADLSIDLKERCVVELFTSQSSRRETFVLLGTGANIYPSRSSWIPWTDRDPM